MATVPNQKIKISPTFHIYAVIIYAFTCLTVNGTERNIALLARTHQTSQYSTETASGLAVDGNLTSFSRTSDEKLSKWTVDLGDVHVIARFKIDTCRAYFGNNFEIYVSSETGDGQSELCQNGPSVEIHPYVESCFGGPKAARFLTISNIYSGGVKLCDVQIYECNEGYFGANCTHQCRCENDVACARENGLCPINCAPGWNGTACQGECAAGTFGPSCTKVCRCVNGSVCDRFTGECPGECVKSFLGPSCQTEVPNLVSPPTVFSTTATQITISWHSWTRFVDPSIKLMYQIEHRLNMHHGVHQWMEGPLLEDTQELNQRSVVSGLTPNSFYDFRVIPILLVEQTKIQGTISPPGHAFNTRCTAPEATNITHVSSWTDESRIPVPVITVEWTLLRAEQINCQAVKYYQIVYGKTGTTQVYSTGARPTEHTKNISSNVAFGTEYWVVTVAYNNEGLESSSNRAKITTLLEPVGNRTPKSAAANMDIAIIAGVIVCVGLLVAIILVLILYRNKRKRYSSVPIKDVPNIIQNDTYSHNDGDVLLDSSMINITDLTVVPMYPENGRINKVKEKPVIKRFPIKVDELEEYISSRQNNEFEDLRKEYREIPEGNVESTTKYGGRTENRLKNRFINIMPYDHSRVILDQIEGDEDSDYINANYLNGYNKPQAYIAAQGCNKWTIQDLWRMIWQVDSYRIVMVTNLVEKGKTKCELYWPETENEPKSYGDLSVTLTDCEKTADFVIRTFVVSRGDDIRNVKQLHYTTWPDHGVPTRTSPIIAFRRKLRSYDETHPGTIVVHCSAGVGRTGAFIAIDYLLDQAAAEGVVDVHSLTSSMRKDRVNMIQTVEQYIFVYDALLEALKAGNTVISCTEFKSTYDSLCHIDPVKGKSGLSEQFEMLESMSAKSKPEVCNLGAHEENTEKNRFSQILPADKHRPYLMTRVQGTNDYINAVFIDGYRSRNAYIITQMPLPHTVIDLWRMVFEHKCGTIVMLNEWDDADQSYGQYWPEENEECECGPFIIEAVSINKDHRDITVRELKLTYSSDLSTSKTAKETAPRTVTHFQLAGWDRNCSVPAASELSVMSLIDMVERSQKKSGNNPIVVHCHDGVRQSGLYVAVTSIFERMKDEQEVDIFQTIKHLRFHRPQILHDLEQYQFCHDMVGTYLDEFALYSNYRR